MNHSIHRSYIYLVGSFMGMLLFTAACQPGESSTRNAESRHHSATAGTPSDSITQLTNEVMTIHDEAMLKMGDIMKLKRQIRREIAQLDSLPATQASAEKKEELYTLQIDLNKADSSMMQWMRDYEPGMQELSRDEKLRYLQNEKIKIQDVQQLMTESIQNAEVYLKQHNQ